MPGIAACTTCFNTQPPEGGWKACSGRFSAATLFQHTAARRRLGQLAGFSVSASPVSTHSRPKAAGLRNSITYLSGVVSTHSRPKAAGMSLPADKWDLIVSTHSRPKAAGQDCVSVAVGTGCFNTQPPEGGWKCKHGRFKPLKQFQHTAARRRLGSHPHDLHHRHHVSTHSRPKAAGLLRLLPNVVKALFQHTAARRRLDCLQRRSIGVRQFQHTAARRRLAYRINAGGSVLIVSTHSRPKAAGC